jgi:SEC-C motif-containing protein
LHAGRSSAVTDEELMRSRYAAFVTGDDAYLRRTWHPDTCPAHVDAAGGPTWTGLRIVRAEAGGAGDTEGTVEFEARYERDGRPGVLREASRFTRLDGRWVYVDGTRPRR